MSNLRRLFGYLKPYRLLFIITLVLSIVYVVLNSFSLWMIAALINTILVSPESIPVGDMVPALNNTLYDGLETWTANLIRRPTMLQTLARLCWVLLAVFLAKNIVFYIKNIVAGAMENSLIRDLRNDIFTHVQRLSLSFFDKQKTAEISSVVLNDVAAIRMAFTVSLQKAIVEPINLVVFITMLIIISWQLSLLAIPMLPLAAFFTGKLGKTLRRRARRTQEQIAGLMNTLQEGLRNTRVIKAFIREDHEIKRFHTENSKYYNLVFRRITIRGLITPINDMIGVTMGIILLWVGGQQVLLGRGVGAEEFMSYIIFLFAMLQPLRNLGNVNADIQTGLASADRIFNLLDEPIIITEKDNARDLPQFNKSLKFENVSFVYESSDRPALKNISTEIKSGEVVALVGASGSGKSTFVDLLPRFYDITGGKISIDGHDIRDLTLSSLRGKFGIVNQETILFNTSVRENIAYGDPDVNDNQIRDAAEAAHAWEFIKDLPDGMDTVIGELGATLSGGQRQRLAIARALIKNPPILIMDEATSALDTESEQRVQAAINDLMQDRTLIVIAHRLSTVQKADKILVLSDGELVETGTHEELLARDGSYRNLHNLQFATANGNGDK